MKLQEMTLKPIGRVRAEKGMFTIEIEEQYRPALAGLDGFGHIDVLWWADRSDTPEQRNITTCRKPYTHGPDTIGIFATRSPQRPNPIAVTTADVISVDQDHGIIRLSYIDAENGTPVIDIKPYHPSGERVRDVVLPPWCSHWPRWYEDSASFDWDREFTG
jgi:tRNA-Thr(GGU) m(6)t(6)A37 methyltransferase TsaA